MKHSMGVVRISLGSKSVVTTRKSYVAEGSVSDVGTTTIIASSSFQGAQPYLYDGKYLVLLNRQQGTTIKCASTSLQKWSDISADVAGGDYLDKTAAVEWPYAWYKYEWYYKHRTTPYTFSTSTTGSGSYRMECWGASGGDVPANTTSVTGYGGYTAGTITLTGTSITLYVYVGGAGKAVNLSTTNYNQGGWNGGGYSGANKSSYEVDYCAGGGGATDIRITYNASPLNFNSLKSRIMVAGGGGGACFMNSSSTGDAADNLSSSLGGYRSNGGNAGGLTGSNGVGRNRYSVISSFLGEGGKQNRAGDQPNSDNGNFTPDGHFGYADQHGSGGSLEPQWWGAGAGGGWYGGAKGAGGGGGGGSSYISGHSGCYAIVQNSTESAITHYDGQGGRATSSKYNNANTWVFTNTSMISGANTSMPKPEGGTAKGRYGDGYAKISFCPSAPLSD